MSSFRIRTDVHTRVHTYVHYLQRILLLCCALFMSACDLAGTAADNNELQIGYWSASLTLPGGEATFGLEIGNDGDALRASLINGQERVDIQDVSFSDGALRLGFPAFNNEIRATLTNGELDGQLTLIKRYGKTQEIPFHASVGFGGEDKSPVAAPDQDLSGRWAAHFTDQDSENYPAVGEFAQRGSALFGTIMTPTGDYRYLAGEVTGKDFYLSTFDGAHAFLFKGVIEDDAGLRGEFWSGDAWHETFSAERSDSAALPDAYSATYLNPGYEKFDFSFRDLDGSQVSLSDPRFQGKVVIVTLAGTWCPNCHDEAAFMAPFYAQYRDQGLEVVALMYEHLEDTDLAIAQIRKFRDKFDITYTTLLAGISDKTEAAKTLPSLNAVLAFPTTLFIDRSGTVRKIHTGFTGPGTGKHYETLRVDFTALVETLLAEPAGTATKPFVE